MKKDNDFNKVHESDFEKDIETLKVHMKAVEDILKPYALDNEVLDLEKGVIDGYKKLYAHKIKMLDIQKDMNYKASKMDLIIRRNLKNGKK